MSLCINPINLRGPYIKEVISNNDNTLVYDGYFYYRDEDLPLQRILNILSDELIDDEGNTYRSLISSSHIEIYERISGEDTSFCEDKKMQDDSDDNICFFPTEITTLKYRILKSDLTDIEKTMIYGVIKEQEKEREAQKIKAIMLNLEEDDSV